MDIDRLIARETYRAEWAITAWAQAALESRDSDEDIADAWLIHVASESDECDHMWDDMRPGCVGCMIYSAEFLPRRRLHIDYSGAFIPLSYYVAARVDARAAVARLVA